MFQFREKSWTARDDNCFGDIMTQWGEISDGKIGSRMSSSYRDLRVWQKSMDLAEHVYRVTETFPRAEIYGLTSQLRRAAVSIPSNIAEGQGRTSKGEFRLFLGNARGSLLEVETQLMLANRMAYLDKDSLSSILEESATVGSMLNGLLASVSKASPNR